LFPFRRTICKDKRIFYYDLNLLTEKSAAAVFHLMSAALFGQSPTLGDSQAIVGEISRFLSFYFSFRPFLQYIFALEREIGDYSPFGPLGTHLSENLLFLPPLDEREGLWLLEEYEKAARIRLTEREKKEIISSSGGFMRTIKRLAQVKSAGQNLDEILENPGANPHLQYHFEQLLADLAGETPTLKNVIFGRISAADEESLKNLRNLYLLDNHNQPIQRLFFYYLGQKFGERFDSEQLTANEEKILKYLFEHKGQICSREELMGAVWGEMGLGEVADHALDQLLHRLRRKLTSASPPTILKTIRGRGIKLEE
jgi:hypothetical protein